MLEGFVGYVIFTFIAFVCVGIYFILESLGEKTKTKAQDAYKKIENTEFYRRKSNEIADKRKNREEASSQKAQESLEKFDQNRAKEKLDRKIKALPEYIDRVTEYFEDIEYKKIFPTRIAALTMVRNLENHLLEIGKYPDYIDLLHDLYRKCEFYIDEKWVLKGFYLWDGNTNIALRQVPVTELKSFIHNNPIQLIINPIICLEKRKIFFEAKYMLMQVLYRESLDQILTFKTFSEVKDNDFTSQIISIRIEESL